MGDKLMRLYQFMKEQKGLDGQIKLAMETKIPSIKAGIAPDSPENIKLLREAIKKLLGKEPPAV